MKQYQYLHCVTAYLFSFVSEAVAVAMTSLTPVPFSHGPGLLLTPTSEAGDKARGLTLFDLPRRARDKIYHHVLHDDAREDPWSNEVATTYVPNAQLGLLCASRRVYEEASAIMYSTVRLGSFAPKAAEYLMFIGPERVRQIRTLVLSYQCRQGCRASNGFSDSLNWAPVFDLLYQAWACVRRVEVHFEKCNNRWKRSHFVDYSTRSQPRLAGDCRLMREVEKDTFFSGLRSFVLAERIEFVHLVPEFFVYRLARDLDWKMEGTVLGDYRDSRQPNTEYRGAVVNPKFPLHFHRALNVHQLIEHGFDVSRLASIWEHYHWGDPSATSLLAPGTPRRKKHLLDLPPELRQRIYEFACQWEERAYWPDRPRRWNSGAGLLQTCKLLSREALPAVYRDFRIYGCSAADTLNRLGLRVSHIQRLELHFSCFCPSDLDMDGVTRTILGREVGRLGFAGWHGALPVCSVLCARYQDMWHEAMIRLQAQPKLKEIEVTFASCCRYKPRLYGQDMVDEAIIRRGAHCCALEDHFLNRLARCHHIERLDLVGDVPPSFALRMSRRVASGPRLRLKWISSPMRVFLNQAETERRQWETNALATEDLWKRSKPTWYPDTPYPTTNPATHFVLVAEETAKAKMNQALGLDRKREGRMELVSGSVSDREWEDVRKIMDHGNRRLSEKRWLHR